MRKIYFILTLPFVRIPIPIFPTFFSKLELLLAEAAATFGLDIGGGETGLTAGFDIFGEGFCCTSGKDLGGVGVGFC